MGLYKKILDFIGGKEPDIFDEKGNVLHKLPNKKWEAWHQRTMKDPEYNWRNHSGVNRSTSANPKKP